MKQSNFSTAQLGDILHYTAATRLPDQSIDECLEDFRLFVDDRVSLTDWMDRRRYLQELYWVRMQPEERQAEMDKRNAETLTEHREKVMVRIEQLWEACHTLTSLIGKDSPLAKQAQLNIRLAVRDYAGFVSSEPYIPPFDKERQQNILDLEQDDE